MPAVAKVKEGNAAIIIGLQKFLLVWDHVMSTVIIFNLVMYFGCDQLQKCENLSFGFVGWRETR
jgi:hypothetical protein